MFWEQYGKYAIGEFSNIAKNHSVNYKFIIYKKNYTEEPINVICAADPVVLNYLSDDIVGIKGSELVVKIINSDNNLPLSNFYSDYDDTFKIVFGVPYYKTVIDPDSGAISTIEYMYSLFTGHLLQEDCSEIITDISHEIELTFTDGLGLLKDIDFYTASLMSPQSNNGLRVGINNINIFTETTDKSTRIVFNSAIQGGNPTIVDSIVIYDSPIGTKAYEIIPESSSVINIGGSVTEVYVIGDSLPMPLTSSQKYAIISRTRLLNNSTGRIRLSDCIRICLHATNLNLNIRYGGNIKALNDATILPEILKDVWVDPRTFYDNGEWDSCYDVLEKICKRFNICLFQGGAFEMTIFDDPFVPKAGANSEWKFVRFEELRYEQNEIPGWLYDGYFNYISGPDASKQIDFGDYTDIEYGIEQSIDRPYNFFSNTYKNESKPWIYNNDFSQLGKKSSTTYYTINGVQFKREEYSALGMLSDHVINSSSPSPARRFLVETNQETGEIQRYLWVYNGVYDGKLVAATSIEAFNGDKIRLSLSYKTQVNVPAPPYNNRVVLIYKQGGNIYGWNSLYDEGLGSDDTTEFREISGEFVIDEDCVLFFCLNQMDPSVGGITYYGPLEIEVTANINGALNAPGHSHTASISKNLRNNDDLEIYLDDTVRNYLSGTLLFNTYINNIRQRTQYWYDGQYTQKYSLGEIMTKEIMARKSKPRVKLEGRILGIVNPQKLFMYMNNGYNFLILNGVYFIIGKAEYNFREDYLDVTMYEMWRDGEYENNLGIKENSEINYEFKYLQK